MKCLTDEQIQIYIDGETTAEERLLVENHLANCQSCKSKFEEMQQRASRLKAVLGSIDKTEVKIPHFSTAKIAPKRPARTIRRLVYITSAACILVVVTLILRQPKEKPTMMYSFEVAGEYNANLPLSEQDMEMVIRDENGKLIQF